MYDFHHKNIKFLYFTLLQMKRLYDTIQVELPTLGFSGRQYFYITKSMILKMIGTILTFEIILLDEIDVSESDICTVID